jgi:hypothetical protein
MSTPADGYPDLISVPLPRWFWIYFLGWLEAKRNPAGETIQIPDIAQAISDAVKKS